MEFLCCITYEGKKSIGGDGDDAEFLTPPDKSLFHSACCCFVVVVLKGFGELLGGEIGGRKWTFYAASFSKEKNLLTPGTMIRKTLPSQHSG